MPSPIESEIKGRIDAFVSELDQLVRKSTLEALRGFLAGGGEVPAPSRHGRPGRILAGSGRPQGSGRRSSANVEEASAKVLEHVKANDGQGISAIAEGTGIDLVTAKKAAASLIQSGQLKKSGQKRGTIYHLGSGRPAPAAKAKKAGKRRGKKAKAS